MPQLTVRNIDDRLYARLKERAHLHRRSIESEVRTILDAALRNDRAMLVREADEFRKALTGRYKGEVAAEIRADRRR